MTKFKIQYKNLAGNWIQTEIFAVSFEDAFDIFKKSSRYNEADRSISMQFDPEGKLNAR